MGTLLVLCLHSFVLVEVLECAQFGYTAWLLVEKGGGVFLPLMLLFLVFLLLQALCSRALPIKVGGFLLLHLHLLRFLFDLDLLCCSPPPLSLLLQFLWSCREMRERTVNVCILCSLLEAEVELCWIIIIYTCNLKLVVEKTSSAYFTLPETSEHAAKQICKQHFFLLLPSTLHLLL